MQPLKTQQKIGKISWPTKLRNYSSQKFVLAQKLFVLNKKWFLAKKKNKTNYYLQFFHKYDSTKLFYVVIHVEKIFKALDCPIS